ncbi:MAG: response regulator [Candidatus Thermoplasmatota archaeon]|nr:response regulator [Candidatus Thermoplasmatota archaeon]MBS3802361.1 response regulator [Candidatus Thermoplasmatota archaeon]
MFVDDGSDQLFSFEQVLKESDEDFEFIGVQSGKECLKELKHAKLPDIIFLDIMMPEMDGWEVCDKLRDNPVLKDIPIVFLTTNMNMTTKHACGSFNDGFLEKPVESKELFNCIEQIIKGK